MYRAGTDFEARPGVDVKPKEGLIPTDRGISVNTNPNNLPKVINKQPVTEITVIDVDDLPSGLKIFQRGKPGHYEIPPEFPMTIEQYQSLLNQIKPLEVIKVSL